MRASLLLESDPSAAAQRASGILAASPGHPAAGLLLATARRKLGDPAAAATLLESLAGAQRDSTVVQLELGRAYAAAGRNAEALSAFRRAVTLDAGLADGWRELAARLHAAGVFFGGRGATDARRIRAGVTFRSRRLGKRHIEGTMQVAATKAAARASLEPR